MSEAVLHQVHLIGCGLIGTSVALDLRAKDVKVTLEDSVSTNLAEATKLGAGSTEAQDSPDLVIVAVPPNAVSEVVIAALEKYPEALVIDVASVKTPIYDALDAAKIDLTRFISTHPMAGKELTGPENANAGLFKNKVWAVIKEQNQTPALVLELIHLLGAKPVHLSAKEHDKAVALTSHTPQLLASVLASLIAEADEAELCLSGQGLLDMVRIAGSDSKLWSDIVMLNTANIVANITALQAKLTNLVEILESSETPTTKDELIALIEQGNSGLAKLKQIQDRNLS
jgi:prephenate dehydrogenase